MPFWDSVKKTVSRPADQLVFVHIPRDGDDVAEPEPELAPRSGYFRVWLSQMFLATESTLLAGWLPAAHARVTVTANGRTTHEFGKVLRPDPRELADGVRVNFALTPDLIVYQGGDVEVEAALLGLQSGNHLDIAVDVLRLVSTLPVPGLDVAAKVSESARDLVSRSDGRVHLNLHQTFIAPGGGGSPLRSTYLALVDATAEEVPPANLRVIDDRLHAVTPGGIEPLVGHDFLLLRVECRTSRPDFWLPEVEDARQRAITAVFNGDSSGAKLHQYAARAVAQSSPLLTFADRRILIESIATQWADIEQSGRGLSPDDLPRTLTEVVARYGPSPEEAAARGPITAAEAFAL